MSKQQLELFLVHDYLLDKGYWFSKSEMMRFLQSHRDSCRVDESESDYVRVAKLAGKEPVRIVGEIQRDFMKGIEKCLK